MAIQSEYNLGIMYRDGLGVDQDDVEALTHFCSAENGHMLANRSVGLAFLRGRGSSRRKGCSELSQRSNISWSCYISFLNRQDLFRGQTDRKVFCLPISGGQWPVIVMRPTLQKILMN